MEPEPSRSTNHDDGTVENTWTPPPRVIPTKAVGLTFFSRTNTSSRLLTRTRKEWAEAAHAVSRVLPTNGSPARAAAPIVTRTTTSVKTVPLGHGSIGGGRPDQTSNDSPNQRQHRRADHPSPNFPGPRACASPTKWRETRLPLGLSTTQQTTSCLRRVGLRSCQLLATRPTTSWRPRQKISSRAGHEPAYGKAQEGTRARFAVAQKIWQNERNMA